jgi:glycosyltransferase involved in cell wall biosynthesis
MRIAFFLSTSGHSGVDRVARNLIPALARRGYAVDLIRVRRHGPYLDLPIDGVRAIDSGSSSTYGAIPALIRYLRRCRPAVLFSDKDRVNRSALFARWCARTPEVRLVFRYGSTVSTDTAHRGGFERWLQRLSMGRGYRRAYRVLVPGAGVAEDMSRWSGLPRAQIEVVPTPLVPASLLTTLPPPPAHPWFASGAPPVILGVGELSARKDFATLIRAFAGLRSRRELRLMILGEGRERAALLALATELGVAEDLELPGFVANPYAYMAHAAAVALTSRWEGLPAVLVEALAVGTPVVATRTPGACELLREGEYGALCAFGDDAAVAQALQACLDVPRDRERLRARVRANEVEASADAHLRAMGLPLQVGGAPGR